uniref:Uncharacterized protein n=1 Tax=Rhizophora mucronata TaxID=61149 RepID=A0A2P2QQF9_RHIMU
MSPQLQEISSSSSFLQVSSITRITCCAGEVFESIEF